MELKLKTLTSDKPTLLDFRRDEKTYPRLCRMSREQVVLHLSPIVLMAYQYRGNNIDAEGCQYIADALAEELLADNPYGTKFITIQEIACVVKKAVLTEEMFGVNVASLYKVIIAYTKGEGHRLQEKVKAERQAERKAALESSPIGAYLQAAAGAMTKTTKV